jgi:hypothetical protein
MLLLILQKLFIIEKLFVLEKLFILDHNQLIAAETFRTVELTASVERY